MKLAKKVVWGMVAWRLLGPLIEPRFRPPQEHPLRLPGRTVFVGDREFLVREDGPADGPVLLLLHGLGGASLAEWYKLLPLLRGHLRVFLFDQRQHGKSDSVRQPFEVEQMADEVAGVMDALGIASAAVAGYSMGGAIAQELAHRHPGRVSHLILVATLTHHPEPHRTLRAFFGLLVRAFERLTGLGTPEVRAAYLRWVGAVEPRHARWSWQETHRRDPDLGALATQSLLRFDSREWIGKLPQPILLFIPSHDQLVPPAWQYDLAGQCAKVKLVEINGGRHELPWTHPERLAKEIVEFLT